MTESKVQASLQVKQLIENIKSLSELAGNIIQANDLDWTKCDNFEVKRHSGTTEISWYNSSDAC